MSYVEPESWQMLDLFTLYRDWKQFPFPGTVLDQPAPMIDAWKIFQTELAAIFGPDHPVTAGELVSILAAAYGVKEYR